MAHQPANLSRRNECDVRPTPASIASATTSSWVWSFVVGALLLLAASVAAALLVRVVPKELGREEPEPAASDLLTEADRPAETYLAFGHDG